VLSVTADLADYADGAEACDGDGAESTDFLCEFLHDLCLFLFPYGWFL
jgi:hypothetical protein